MSETGLFHFLQAESETGQSNMSMYNGRVTHETDSLGSCTVGRNTGPLSKAGQNEQCICISFRHI